MRFEDYREMVMGALRLERKYSAALDIQVIALASALWTLDAANRQIGELKEVTVLEETRYGSKMAPHPAFKIQRDAIALVTKQMKQLALTVEAISGGDENDPLESLHRELIEAMKGEK